MKLKSAIDLYAGGPGSGCHGENCGRPHGSHAAISYKAGFLPMNPESRTLNGVPFKSIHNPSFSLGLNHKISEPELKVPDGKHAAAGIIIKEPDGKIWVVAPTGKYGGYNHTFPKGTIEPGESPQYAAIRETYEETGFLAKVDKYLGDYERSTSVTRYYIGHRLEGAPWGMGWESQRVKLAFPDKEKLDKMFRSVKGEQTIDHKILQDLGL